MFKAILISLLIATATSVFSQPCGITCLSTQDQRNTSFAQGAMSRWSDGLRTASESGRASNTPGSEILGKMSSIGRITVTELIAIRNETKSHALRKFYSRIADAISDHEQLARVGSRLLEAQEQNQIELLKGLATTVVTNEAKGLAAPVFDRVSLSVRIQELGRRSKAKEAEIDETFRIATLELKRETGVEF
jgi:hypothetical protein